MLDMTVYKTIFTTNDEKVFTDKQGTIYTIHVQCWSWLLWPIKRIKLMGIRRIMIMYKRLGAEKKQVRTLTFYYDDIAFIVIQIWYFSVKLVQEGIQRDIFVDGFKKGHKVSYHQRGMLYCWSRFFMLEAFPVTRKILSVALLRSTSGTIILFLVRYVSPNPPLPQKLWIFQAT